jgi:hypothetical protein
MSTIQNLKNFIRHGKQARDGRSPQAEPTTHVSNVHAQQDRGNHNEKHFGIPAASDPNVYAHKPLQASAPQGNYSAAVIDNRNVAAKAHNAAGAAVDKKEKRDAKANDYDNSVLERIVAEERESKGKLPRYPGLERYILIEKMGDGAFSNVYRAKDTQGEVDEVAIKVVRKFEMNSTQVSSAQGHTSPSPPLLPSSTCIIFTLCCFTAFEKLCQPSGALQAGPGVLNPDFEKKNAQKTVEVRRTLLFTVLPPFAFCVLHIIQFTGR